MNSLFLILIVPTILIGLWAQMRISSTYNRYVRVPSQNGIRGHEAAAYVMRQAGIDDVEIVAIEGHLTDHYDPLHKRLCLSRENYLGTSLAALGVAAHEAGHAIQHKVGYSMLKLRMALVPATTMASKILPFAIFGGFLFHASGLIMLGIIAYAVLTLFQLITLPVEFDASKRAVVHLDGLGIIQAGEMPGVKATLNAAAWTYVAAFISSLAWLLYLILSRR